MRLHISSMIVYAVSFTIAPLIVAAQMSGGQYRIGFDSMNAGGSLSGSESYSLEDTTGEISTGDSQSETYKMKAGYQQMNASYISISDGADIALSNLSGLTENTSTGSTQWTVITDSPAGYSLGVRATSSPALVHVSSSSLYFSDYVPQGSDPDQNFINATSSAVFAFNPDGADIKNKYVSDGSSCNPSPGLTFDSDDICWDGFATSTKDISQGPPNHPSGAQTILNVRAANGPDHIQAAGTYRAVLIVTALAL